MGKTTTGPRRTRNWNKHQPRSLKHAMELCLAYALETRNLNVDRVADLMGLSSHWTLYKWLENGRMPAILIRPFEHACGQDFMTRYLAHSGNKLIIPIPTGKRATRTEVSELGSALAQMNSLLHLYYDGERDAQEVIENIISIMEDLAYHKGNLEKEQQPELDLQ